MANFEYDDSEYDDQPTGNDASFDDKETRNWAMILHLSVFAGYLVPLAGLIAPIIIWEIKKDSLPGLYPHSRIVFNFMISMIIYSVICIALCFALIGFLLLPLLGILAVIFPIIGGIKASEGKVWHYPMMIKFF